MKINNSTEFLNFVRSNNLINISPEISAFVRCVDEYSSMCPCDSESSRRAKIEQCKSFYSHFLSKAPQFKDQLLSKINDGSLVLCQDGQVVVNLTR